ncbi:DUF2851 domain-containing protein [Echinicola strongylocentroti]|uniref:DUF2851 domain-containing protein n=1 Tax=Echinicola strongylocentroti TaxID=1795355 RepID=A0A2Z4IK71_9BACT|nr:DUF2851 family protein [Echinicola strongylocentroti]AWW31335.1 DUF2851 domain-containing protein [Echinicola strongylocentroti]
MHFREDFIHAVWKYQYFDKRGLTTVADAALEIKKIGFQNFHQGPDFSEAHVAIDGIDFFGNIEVHIRSSDWDAHGHEDDENYDSVILHVVWEHDMEVSRNDSTYIPTLELKGKVYLDVLRNYQRLISTRRQLLCSDFLADVKPIIKFSMLERALVERLQEKSKLIHEEVRLTSGDWEEVAYRWLFHCFGFKVNSEPMLKLAKAMPYRLVKKHADQPLVQEALLMGQAGFCYQDKPDDYTLFMKREYEFYRKKYQLGESIYPSEWKFMRVRPGNYPSVRISQLVAVLSKSPSLFSLLIHKVRTVSDLAQLFRVKPNAYWEHHYQLSKKSGKSQNRLLSNRTLQLLGINFIAPLWYAYGKYTDEEVWRERCFDFLQEIPAEENRIITSFQTEGWIPESAYDTQGMIGVHHAYCSLKKCLGCKIGQNVLRPAK